MDMIDFLVAQITEEAEDAGTYMEWAAKATDKTVKETLNNIGKQELGHQKMLIAILGNMAKEACKN